MGKHRCKSFPQSRQALNPVPRMHVPVCVHAAITMPRDWVIPPRLLRALANLKLDSKAQLRVQGELKP